MKPNLILIAKWITALRSGKFQQTRAALKKVTDNGQFAHCCLGVACEVAGATSAHCRPSPSLHQFNGCINYPPPHVRITFGCDIHILRLKFPDLPAPVTLAYANDNRNKTFLEIADAIELHFNLSPRKS